MRGVAALLVVLRHAPEYFGAQPFFRSHLAVDLFFVLSGFVIAHAYDRRFAQRSMTSASFMTTRLIRLYPMYLLGLVAGVVWATVRRQAGLEVYSIARDDLARVTLLSLAFLPSHLNPSLALFPLNGPSWSLFYELVTNVIYAFCQQLLRTWVLVVSLCGLAVLLVTFGWRGGTLDIGALAGPIAMLGGSTRAFLGLAFGLLLYRVFIKGLSIPSGWRHPAPPLLIVALVFAVPQLPALDWLLEVVAVLVILPVCVLWSAGTTADGRMARVFGFLGMLSYPMYALHWPLAELGKVLLREEIDRYRPMSGVLFLLLLCAVCVVAVRYVDEPVRRWLTKSVERRRLA
jgi:peptidoglycan/LPS O-acetylase OafA/YrhL